MGLTSEQLQDDLSKRLGTNTSRATDESLQNSMRKIEQAIRMPEIHIHDFGPEMVHFDRLKRHRDSIIAEYHLTKKQIDDTAKATLLRDFEQLNDYIKEFFGL